MRKAYVQMVAFYWSAKTVIFVLGAVPARRGETGIELPPPPAKNKRHFPRPCVQSHREIDPFFCRRDGLRVFSKDPVCRGAYNNRVATPKKVTKFAAPGPAFLEAFALNPSLLS